MLRMSRAIVSLIIAFLPGCANDHSSPNPTAPSSTVPQVVQQQGLVGYVGDTAFRSVAGARVEMLDGPQAGVALISGVNGGFSFSGTFYSLTARGATFFRGYDNFPIGVAGDDAAFMVYQGEDFGLVEEIAPGTFLAYSGQGRLSVGTPLASTISVALDGAIDYCVLQSGLAWSYDCNSGPRIAYSRCESKNHRLILTRR